MGNFTCLNFAGIFIRWSLIRDFSTIAKNAQLKTRESKYQYGIYDLEYWSGTSFSKGG